MSPVANSVFSRTAAVPLRGLTQVRVPVSEVRTEWRGAVMSRLESLIQLEDGWDGYKAPPVRLENAYFTLQMLAAVCQHDTAAPQIVPGSVGDLQVEWHDESGEIELHVRAPNSVTGWRVSKSVPEGEEVELTNDFLVVVGWIQEILGDRSVAVPAAA
jgi:hypothetical protein